MCFAEAIVYACLVLVKFFICQLSLKMLSSDDNLKVLMLSMLLR